MAEMMSPKMNVFNEETPPRTMGSETEYTARLSRRIDDMLPVELAAYYATSDDIWLKNGARLYKDYGGVLEYATPECTSGSSVLLHERIGELIVRDMGDRIVTCDDEGNVVSDVQSPVYKRTGYGDVFAEEADETGGDDEPSRIMSSEITTGHHETYQTGIDSAMLEDPLNYRFLCSYLATRLVWSGTGVVTPDGYELSQKAGAIDFHGDDRVSHGHKMPFLHKGMGLLEIRTGEGNMSDWAIRTKFDMTSLVLRLIEHGTVPEHLLVSEKRENVVMQAASINPMAPIISDYEAIDAVTHQLNLAKFALGFAEKHDVPKDELRAAREVIAACRQIRDFYRGSADLTVISDRIDWAAKLDKLRSRMLLLGEFTSANLVAVYHDLSWENTARDGAARRWYRRRQQVIDEADIRRNLRTPPSALAKSRTRHLEELDAATITNVDWSFVYTKDNRCY